MDSSAEASKKEAVVRELRSTILGHEGAEPERNCLVCQIENSNWLNRLQDVLENHGISVEEFAEASGNYFIVERGRLRMKHDKQCMSIPKIGEMLEICLPVSDRDVVALGTQELQNFLKRIDGQDNEIKQNLDINISYCPERPHQWTLEVVVKGMGKLSHNWHIYSDKKLVVQN